MLCLLSYFSTPTFLEHRSSVEQSGIKALAGADHSCPAGIFNIGSLCEKSAICWIRTNNFHLTMVALLPAELKRLAAGGKSNLLYD